MSSIYGPAPRYEALPAPAAANDAIPAQPKYTCTECGETRLLEDTAFIGGRSPHSPFDRTRGAVGAGLCCDCALTGLEGKYP